MPGTWGQVKLGLALFQRGSVILTQDSTQDSTQVFLQTRDSIDALLEASQCCWNLGCQLMNEVAAALRFGAIAEEAED